MKKLLSIAVIALAGITAYATEAGASQQPAKTPAPAVRNSATTVKQANTIAKKANTQAKKMTGTATKSSTNAKKATTAVKAGGVIKLNNDNQYRPDTTVKRLTVLDFNATWCGPCKQFAPAFEQAAKEFGGKVDFISVDTDVNPHTAQAFGIQAIPTVIFLSPDGKTKKFVGTEEILPAERFISIVRKAL